MGTLQTLDKWTTYFIIAFFLVGVVDTASLGASEIPIYEVAIEKIESGDTGYIYNILKMGWGWSQVAPSFQVDDLPIILAPFSFYTKLIIPSGYLPYPGAETFLFLGLVLLLLLPLAILIKNRRATIGKMGLPLKFYASIPILILLLYPIWTWLNLQLFASGASTVFNISKSEAINIWTGFGQQSEKFSFFFLFMAALGIYKGGKWGFKFKKW